MGSLRGLRGRRELFFILLGRLKGEGVRFHYSLELDRTKGDRSKSTGKCPVSEEREYYNYTDTDTDTDTTDKIEKKFTSNLIH